MLNGSIDKPFSAKSIFGSIEIKKLKPKKINYMNVVLIGREDYPMSCKNDSLQELEKTLNPKFKYTCTAVQLSTILKCLEDPQKPCGPCWE